MARRREAPHSFVLAARLCRSDGAVEWMAQSLDRAEIRSVGRLHVLAASDTDALDQGLLRALLEVQVYHPVVEAAAAAAQPPAPLQVYVTSATARHRLLTSTVCCGPCSRCRSTTPWSRQQQRLLNRLPPSKFM
jgi:hypothetical protein